MATSVYKGQMMFLRDWSISSHRSQMYAVNALTLLFNNVIVNWKALLDYFKCFDVEIESETKQQTLNKNWYRIKCKQKNTTKIFQPSLFMEIQIISCGKLTELWLNHLLPVEWPFCYKNVNSLFTICTIDVINYKL